mmetsp:Transcript_6014/g.9319  ORF Transcript_6014/g.9319 Transcript_6014/m.9319 type:complete len:281 (+) Transcript_6014:70-912(+)|eukprot:CAMPEP_0201737068 /NCGR_PEP_ID=MMETSP0593-20130828/41378_1 /ASSEMBLY_ACC=CAM_ASM_000672 /TAXON_ID=267983 /ORGANISM="Skeletonema japonicum, Strain CCMP2506" /LENGTH=280 /DNA_ID=CAMNT_0048230951 /DNA_START=11 /DNA_END=853 /DNA_ORIENTATION=+
MYKVVLSLLLQIVTLCGCKGFFLYPSKSTAHYTSMMSASKSDSVASDEPSKLLVSSFHQISTTSDPDAKLRLILASQSPRRREILEMMGLAGRFTASPSPLDEEKLQIELSQQEISPSDYARTLAERKAHAYGAETLDITDGVALIIGSDTIVDLDGSIMEKPTSENVAHSMLSNLSGNWHQVHTGVAVYAVGASASSSEPQLMFSFTDTARVKFSSLTDRDIKAYIDTKEPFDKAGSYGIQGIGGQLVERIEGDFFTVMGLPMHRLSRELTDVIKNLNL